MRFRVEPYREEQAEEWDAFVQSESLNGTFIQTRNFYQYHPEGRFRDCSLWIREGEKPAAVVPACLIQEEGRKGLTFFSHRGGTFGGIVLGEKYYRVGDVGEIVSTLDAWLDAREDISRAVLKQTPGLYARRDMALLDYELFHHGYRQVNELNLYVPCAGLPEDPVEAMSSSCRRDYRKAEKAGLCFRPLATEAEVAAFYELLKISLSKFDLKPIHTLPELLDFRERRLKDIALFHGVFLGDTLMAGSMCFNYGNRVLHAQYLSTSPEFQKYYPLYLLDASLIRLARDRGFDAFSFGISTEDQGRVLNQGLAEFKERFASDYSIYRTFHREKPLPEAPAGFSGE